MAQLTALTAVLSMGLFAVASPIVGAAVPIGMLLLLTLAFVSPAGPTILFENPAHE